MQNRRVALLVALTSTVAVFVACADTGTELVQTGPNTHLVTFAATMTGPNEVPATTSTGTGTFTATLDTVTNIFTWDITFTGLTSGVNNGHIHGPAANATVTAGTTINFSTAPAATFSLGQTSGTGHGVMILSASTQITATPAPGINGDSLKKLLFAGLTYANIHTINNPGGEIRGTITKQP